MAIILKIQGTNIVVSGQTFMIKESIKGLGGRFNGVDKTWNVPLNDGNMAALETIQRKEGGGKAPVMRSNQDDGPVAEEKTAPLRASPSPSGYFDFPPWDVAAIDSPGRAVSVAPAADRALPAQVEALQLPPWDFTGEAVTASVALAFDEPTLTIAELLGRAKAAIEKEFRGGVWVMGEIENITFKDGRVFLSLAAPKDEGSQVAAQTIKATVWSENLAKLRSRHGLETVKEILQDGLQIRCFCQVSLFKDRGSLTVSITDIDPAFTKGNLALAREKLLKKLRSEGLDGKNKALPLPPFPFRVGLITSENSRAETDFTDQLFTGGFPGEVLFIPTPMQGEQVPKAVAGSIQLLIDRGVDVIVMTRGGGSTSDLRWFDAEECALAICRASCPIIAAIGHHDDTCVAELVAHHREKTPTAAAEFVLGIFAATRQRIDTALNQLSLTLSRKVDVAEAHHRRLREGLLALGLQFIARLENRLGQVLHRSDSQSMAVLTALRDGLARSAHGLEAGGLRILSKANEGLLRVEGVLKARDPKPWFARGWTQLSKDDGTLVMGVGDVGQGDKVSARLKDGRLELTVEAKKAKK